jgi:hypothetical protein
MNSIDVVQLASLSRRRGREFQPRHACQFFELLGEPASGSNEVIRSRRRHDSGRRIGHRSVRRLDVAGILRADPALDRQARSQS